MNLSSQDKLIYVAQNWLKISPLMRYRIVFITWRHLVRLRRSFF
jgi:hypothetical protein